MYTSAFTYSFTQAKGLLEVVAMELPQKLLLRCCAENAEFGKLMPVLVVPEVPEVPKQPRSMDPTAKGATNATKHVQSYYAINSSCLKN